MCANLGQDREKLSRGEHRRCAAPNIDGLDGTACGYVLLRRQSDLMNERSDKNFCAALAMDFKVEGAEVTSLPAEGDVEVQTEGWGYHDDRLNPCGVEKSRARTISISSAGDFPRLRTCVCQDRC